MRFVLLLILSLPAIAEGPMPFDVLCPEDKPYCLINRQVLKEMVRGQRTPDCGRST